MVRGIIAAILLMFSSLGWGSEICERLLKQDFRETSNIRLAYNDSGLIIESQTNRIQKIRFGSAAANTPLQIGDRILALDGKALPENFQDAYRRLANLLETSAMRDSLLTVQKATGEIETINLQRLPY